MTTPTATFTALPRYESQGVSLGPSKWEVCISYDHPRFPGCYGYFEHDVQGEGGGLWFEKTPEGQWALTDYDGVFTLPRSIVLTLRTAGFIVSADFE